MAGFDFEFRYRPSHETIVEACLYAAQSRARRLDLSWTWRTKGLRQILVTVDGNSRRTDLLGYRLERDLPLVAEGCRSGSASARERQRLGRGFVDLMLRGRHLDQEDVMSLSGVEATRFYYPPYELECPASPRLHARLSVTQEVIVAWAFDEIAPEVLLEELHTACELVLEELVNRRAKKVSFADLVAKALRAGLLETRPDETPPGLLLISLKDLRKDVRHRAAEGAGAWMEDYWQDTAILLERLVGCVNSVIGRADRSAPNEGARTCSSPLGSDSSSFGAM